MSLNRNRRVPCIIYSIFTTRQYVTDRRIDAPPLAPLQLFCTRRRSLPLLLLPAMVSTPQGAKPQDLPFGDSGEVHRSEEADPDPLTARRSGKPRAPGKVTSKQKGKRREGRRNAGKLSKLPDMPLDILYEVSHRIIFITGDSAYDVFGVCRYYLLYSQLIYYGYRGPARPFVTSSQTSSRGRFG